jgi:transcriptional regulator
MYVPSSYELTDEREVAAILTECDFALVITRLVSGEIFMDHVPLLHDPGERVIYGHLARQNPHAHAITNAETVTAIFSGPHAYVSPRWYASQGIVPTWNYVAIHVHGVTEPISDSKALEVLARQVDKYESSEMTPWEISELGGDRLRALLPGIVSFRIAPRWIEAKAKLSQTRSSEDRTKVIAALEEGGTDGGKAVARLMRRGLTA